MKAEDLKPGHVLVGPDGHLYEVLSVDMSQADKIHAWMWPDSSPVPNYWQTFDRGEEIVSIKGGDSESGADGTAE